MELKLCLLFGAILCLGLVQHVASTSDALLECGRVHHIDNIVNLSTATATYRNNRCMLVCVIGSVILPVDSIHEGKVCPEDSDGICRAGQCIGGQEAALRECGLKHNLDLTKVDNPLGTAFTNDQCMLKCVLGGALLSTAHLYEGLLCPGNPNGVCRSGACVTRSTNTVTESPTTVTSIDTFSPSKINLLNVTLESTHPTINQNQRIQLYFYEHPAGTNLIATFYGNPTISTKYDHKTMRDIPHKIGKNTQMSIDLLESVRITEQMEDIYTMFAGFYRNHNLPYGEKEDFVAKFPIYRRDSPHEKLMDVGFRFTIVFSK